METSTGKRQGSLKLYIVMAFFIIYAFWGFSYLAVRYAVETIPPLHLIGIRNFTAGLVLFSIARTRFREKLTPEHWFSAVKIGSLLFVFCHMGVVTASKVLPSGLVALVVTTIPVWMVLIDWAMRYSERPGWRVILGIILGTAGMAFLIGPGNLVGIAGGSLFSVVFLILATVSWSFGSIYSKKAKLPDSVILSSAMQMMTGGAVSLLILTISGHLWDLDLTGISNKSIFAFFFLMIFASIIAYTVYAWLLRKTAASKVATYTYVNAVIALSAGWLAGDGEMNSRIIFSAVMIIAGVVIILSSNKNNKNGKKVI
ncbi:MAG: EamA family transporter [Acidobacteria bacterium]|nr:EamA family transporter [Acidobacteriota bacterium]